MAFFTLRNAVRLLFLTIATVALFNKADAATVYFNTVYQGSGTYTVSSSSMTLAATKLSGSNFKFTDGLVNGSFGTGNNINGTFSYYDANGVLQSITGTISRQDKSGNNTLGVYFYTNNTAYFFIIPGKESNYSGGSTFNTSGDPMGAALDGVVNTTPTVVVSTYALTAFTTCQNVASAAQTLTVSGKNLTANITITAPSGFEISKTSPGTSGYATSLTLTPTSGTVSATTIWVRLAAGNPGAYGPSIMVSSSTNSNDQKTTVSGTIYANAAITAQPSTASQSLCTGGSSTALSVTATGYNLSYQWYWNSTNANTGGTAISGATNATYSPATDVSGTRYYYVVVSGGCGSAVTSTVSGAITVAPTSVGGTISGGSTVCTGTNSTTLTLSAYTGTINRWESSTNSTFTSPLTIANTTTSYTASNLTATTYYRAVVTSGSCSAAYSSTATVTVSQQPTTANAGSSQTICSGNSATMAANTPSVGTGAWSIVSGPGTNIAQFADIASPTSLFSPTRPGTYVLRWTITNGACSSSADVTIVVNSVNYISGQPSTASESICLGSALSSFTVTANTSGLNYEWYSNTVASRAGGTLVATHSAVSGTSDTFTPSSNTADTLYYYVKVIDNSGCGEYSNLTGAIVVYDLPTSANAGADQSLQLHAALNANTPFTGTGSWSILSGSGGSFDDIHDPHTSFNGTIGTTYTLRWTITNGICTSTDDVDILVTSPTIIVSPSSLNSGTVGVSYSQTITASGGIHDYTFAITAGSLPAGLTLSSSGVISGTPTAGGTFSFTVTATDSSVGQGPYSGNRAYTLTVNAPSIVLNPTSLPGGTVGVSYSNQVTATGGTAAYTYAITSGSLPAGLTLSSSGAINGVPTAGGTFSFTVTATDSSTGTGAPYSGSRAYTIAIGAPSITINPTTLPDATIASAYSQTLTATGGTAPYTYAITAGSLPAGLTLSSSGAITGTPTAGGTFNITVTATDSSSGTGAPYTGSQAYTINVNAPIISILPSSLPNGNLGTIYSQNLGASGGTPTYTYIISAGSLPAGLTLSSSGVISGTPTAGGTFSFTVTTLDSSTGAGPYTGSQSYTITISAPTITISPSNLPNGNVASAYSQTVTATGGTAPYTYAITAGSLPAGLTLSSSGVISGTPTAGGTFNFTITATDATTGAGPYTGSRAYALTIGAPTISFSPSTLPNGTVATAYSQTVTATGGTAPYTYAITAGSLPAGLTLSSSGVISGTPTAGGTFNFTITATDATTGAGPYTGSRAYALTIGAPTISISPSTLPNGTVASAYSQTVTAAGGTAPYTYAITAGSLPTGLTLSSSGVISGTPNQAGNFTFTVTATDASVGSAFTGSRSYTLTIVSAITINPSSLPNGTLGSAYSQSLTATGGVAPYTFSLLSGTLPAGLTLSAGGVLSGTPTVGGTFNFTVKATDSFMATGPFSGTRSYSLIIIGNSNQAPTNIILSKANIFEANALNAVIGNLSTTDPDVGDTPTYTLVTGTGSSDNGSFTIVGNQLKAAQIFNYNQKSGYSIRIRTTDAGGLYYEKTFIISISQTPVVTGTGYNAQGPTPPSTAPTVSKGFYSDLNVSGTGLVSFSWTPVNTLNAGNIANPRATPANTISYAVTVTNSFGSTTTVFITVTVLEDYNVQPTNIITPNGDGVNDTWEVGNINSYPDNEVTIIDKAGRILHVEKNYHGGWGAATLNGSVLAEGGYYYVIKFGSGKSIVKGYITVIREAK